jgi:Uncharacterised protein conserved in bacteria (DUF2336)
VTSLQQTLNGISDDFRRKAPEARARTVDQLSSLFLMSADSFGESHVAVFDQVISLLADEIEVRARLRLAEKLADHPKSPRGVIRRLAKDQIDVARPVLSRSPVLTDEDLVEVARAGGRDHMLAISERKDISEVVTDVLVSEGDRIVMHAVANNPNARFSTKGYDILVYKSHADPLLQTSLGQRSDVPRRHLAALFELAKAAARERLSRASISVNRRALSQAIEMSADEVAHATSARAETLEKAMNEVSNLVELGELDEETLMGFAKQGQAEYAAAGLGFLARVPLPMAQRAITSSDNDLMLIIARASALQWPTVRALFSLRGEHRPGVSQLDALSDSYAKLTPATALRVLRFLMAKESAVSQTAMGQSAARL